MISPNSSGCERLTTRGPLRVLLVGFGAFPGTPRNPTIALVNTLARSRRAAMRNIACVAHVLPVRFAEIGPTLAKLVDTHRPDIVLMFGLAARTRYIRIETRAQNAMTLVFPDASGARAERRAIARFADSARIGRASPQALLSAVRTLGLPARLSRDAGHYICNLAYWHGLDPRPDERAPLVSFIHVPRVRHGSRARHGVARPMLTGADLLRAGEAILVALAAQARRTR